MDGGHPDAKSATIFAREHAGEDWTIVRVVDDNWEGQDHGTH